jgi:hypothetical protein
VVALGRGGDHWPGHAVNSAADARDAEGTKLTAGYRVAGVAVLASSLRSATCGSTKNSPCSRFRHGRGRHLSLGCWGLRTVGA